MSSDKSKQKLEKPGINVAAGIIDKLLENLLLGNTTILPVNVVETMIGAKVKEVTSRHQNVLTRTSFPQNNCTNDMEFGIKPATMKMLNKHAPINEIFSTTSSVMDNMNHSSDFDDESCSVVNLEETETRTVTPTDFHHQVPVSEQFLCAKRILKQNNYSNLEPPDFSHLTPDLEEAFTVSTGHLTQIIAASSEELFRKLDASFNERTSAMERSIKRMTAQIEDTNSLYTEILKAQNSKITEVESAMTKAIKDAGTKNKSAATNEYDVIFYFKAFLIKTKMMPEDVEKHATAVRNLIGNEALAYMARFGFAPKYKKK